MGPQSDRDRSSPPDPEKSTFPASVIEGQSGQGREGMHSAVTK
jgi:hypothetical protein